MVFAFCEVFWALQWCNFTIWGRYYLILSSLIWTPSVGPFWKWTSESLKATTLETFTGLNLTDFVNGVCACVRACVMDHCHNSGAEQMGSLRQVFSAHIRGDQECCLTAVRESPHTHTHTHQHSLHAGVCVRYTTFVCVCVSVKLNGIHIPLPPPIPSEEKKIQFPLIFKQVKKHEST